LIEIEEIHKIPENLAHKKITEGIRTLALPTTKR
jgi:hypothetical protein